MVENGEEGMTVRVGEGATNCQQDNHHPSRFQSLRENMTLMSTLNGKRLTKLSQTKSRRNNEPKIN